MTNEPDGLKVTQAITAANAANYDISIGVGKQVLRITASGELIIHDPSEAAKALKAEWDRIMGRAPVAAHPVTGSDMREALEWISDYVIKLRKGTDDWFDLVEIEARCVRALSQPIQTEREGRDRGFTPR